MLKSLNLSIARCINEPWIGGAIFPEMKIEMGESLFYSWLRHVKECQVVQTNWKVSPSWQLRDEGALQRFMEVTGDHFQSKYGYSIYKNNTFLQLLMQAEIDAIGICLNANNVIEAHAVDVAFHKNGLLYRSGRQETGRQETVTQVIKKSVRSAMCMVGYFGVTNGEVIFASPKIHNAVMNDLEPCIADLNALFTENGYGFTARVIANDDFNDHILKPILIASDGVSDTSELFMRGYQLVTMFGDERPIRQRLAKATSSKVVSDDTLSELKIGKIAQTLLREALENGNVNDEEVALLQTKDYPKSAFGIDFPLLVPVAEDCDSARYYTKPLTIQGKQYRLCSQWFEVATNNDRPFLLAWLEEHGFQYDPPRV
ncbi:MAG: hypothetical protein LBK56_03975 [Gracilibacteraceae bacterium]|jgi:hypothetical protein|nr:hypothetical protein [Gracilibacteraceae bacterium]